MRLCRRSCVGNAIKERGFGCIREGERGCEGGCIGRGKRLEAV